MRCYLNFLLSTCLMGAIIALSTMACVPQQTAPVAPSINDEAFVEIKQGYICTTTTKSRDWSDAIYITYKNTGDVPVKSVYADIQLFDAAGKPIGKPTDSPNIKDQLVFQSDVDPILPGKSNRTDDQSAFFLPLVSELPPVSKAVITITRVNGRSVRIPMPGYAVGRLGERGL